MSDALSDVHLLRLPVAREDSPAGAPGRGDSTLRTMASGAIKICLDFGLSGHDGEEVVQEVFLALFSQLKCGRDKSNLSAWLFRVAHNLAIKRRMSSRGEIPDGGGAIGTLAHPAQNPEEELASVQRQRRFSSILDALPEQDRRCLYLRAEGLRYREISEVLGMSLGSVAASLQRTLARFQRADQR